MNGEATFVVRIYKKKDGSERTFRRKGKPAPRRRHPVFGVVEDIEHGKSRPFRNADELLEILCTGEKEH